MKTTLSADIGFADSNIAVADPLTQEVPFAGQLYALIESEYVRIVAGTGSQLWLVERGALDSARTGHAAGTAVEVINPALLDRGDLEPAPFAPAGCEAIAFAELDANGDIVGAVTVPAGSVLRAISVGQIVSFDAATADLVVDVAGTDLGSATDLTAAGGTDVAIDLTDGAAAGLLDAAVARVVTATVTIASHAGTDGRARVVVSWDNPATSVAAAAA